METKETKTQDRYSTVITPVMAKLWLERNKQNRPVRERDVRAIADDILNGKWESETPNSICFDENGDLIDGQHRLLAVVKANMPIKAYVIQNLKRSYYIDNNKRRTLSDRIIISGKANKGDMASDNHVIASISWILREQCNIDRVTEDMIVDFVESNPEIEIVHKLGKKNGSNGVVNLRGGYVLSAVFLALHNNYPEETILEWFALLSSGIPKRNDKTEEQVLELRNRIIRIKNGEAFRNKPRNEEKREIFYKCQHSISNYCLRIPKSVRNKNSSLWTYKIEGVKG